MPDDDIRQIYSEALEENRFELHYQPICDISTGRQVGYEALLRLPPSDMGPSEFLPAISCLGLMPSVNEWVINRVTEDLKRIPKYLWVAINISELEGIENQINSAAARGLDLKQIRLEIVESLTINTGAIATLSFLRSQGIKLEWDDFGTGWNGMTRIALLKADALKLDSFFVQGVANDPIKQAICRAGIALCHHKGMGMEVIAEGLECPQDRGWLLQAGCNLGQGFLFGKPEPLPTKSP